MEIQEFDGRQASREHRRHMIWPPWIADSYFVSIPVANYLDCESYHAEISCPSGTYLHRARLRIVNESDELSELILIEDDDKHPDRSHLHFNRRLPRHHVNDDNYYEGSLELILRPTYNNGLRSGANISVVSTAILWFLVSTVGWQAANIKWHLTHLSIGRFDTNSIVSLLLLAPTVVITLIVRQDEHHLTKEVLGRYRTRLALTGLVLFASALVIGVRVQGWHLFWTLTASSAAVTIMTLQTLMSARYSKRQVRKGSYSA
jgi:hypothetical protein